MVVMSGMTWRLKFKVLPPLQADFFHPLVNELLTEGAYMNLLIY